MNTLKQNNDLNAFMIKLELSKRNIKSSILNMFHTFKKIPSLQWNRRKQRIFHLQFWCFAERIIILF